MKNLIIGNTYTTKTGSQVTVRRQACKNMYIVSYGFNRKGEDVKGLLHVDLLEID